MGERMMIWACVALAIVAAVCLTIGWPLLTLQQ